MSRTLILSLTPEWSGVDRVRRETARFLSEQLVSEAARDAVVMIACELTENAAKYGDFQSAEDGIDVSVFIQGSTVTVEVRNPVSQAAAERLFKLDGMIQWIRGFQDPFEAYLNRLKEVSAQTLDHQESGLGLVRIAYEGQSVLDFVFDHPRVAVSAVHRAV